MGPVGDIENMTIELNSITELTNRKRHPRRANAPSRGWEDR